MGTTNSVEMATNEIEHVMQLIDEKCNAYLMSVEHTNSVVDVTLRGLRKEIFELIEPLRSCKSLIDLGAEDMSAMLEVVERHANTQKFVMQRLLDIMFETQATFANMADETMTNADVDEVPEILLDEAVVTTMRNEIEEILRNFKQEIKLKDISEDVINRRCEELQRLLFKLAEVTVSNMVEETVSEMKDAFLEDIDNMICESMMSGQFKQALAARECLQNIISKSFIARVSLEALPFSRRVELEMGQDEIEEFVDNLVRKVQMHHCNEETQHFEQLMNLDLDYSDDVSSSDSSEESGDEEMEEQLDDKSPPKPKKVAKKNEPKTKTTTKKTTSKSSPSSAKKSPKGKRPTRKRKEASTDETTKRATRSRR